MTDIETFFELIKWAIITVLGVIIVSAIGLFWHSHNAAHERAEERRDIVHLIKMAQIANIGQEIIETGEQALEQH